MVKAESGFDMNSKGGSSTIVGMCQLDSKYHSVTAQNLFGDSDLMNPEINIKMGIFLLANYKDMYNKEEMALIAYNVGRNGAEKLFSQGIYSTTYSQKVLTYKNDFLQN